MRKKSIEPNLVLRTKFREVTNPKVPYASSAELRITFFLCGDEPVPSTKLMQLKFNRSTDPN